MPSRMLDCPRKIKKIDHDGNASFAESEMVSEDSPSTEVICEHKEVYVRAFP